MGADSCESNGIGDNHLASRLRVTSRAVSDGCRATGDCVDLRRVDGQSSRFPRVSRCRVHSTAVVEMLSRMVEVVCGGQGREEGHRQCCELHGEINAMKIDSKVL